MTTLSNKRRISHALDAVLPYAERDQRIEAIDEDFVDLLADLYHLAKKLDVDMQLVLACAKYNFEKEIKE